MRGPLTALTLGLALLAAGWGALVVLEGLARAEARETRALDLGGAALVLETGSGDVDVVAAPGPARLEVRSVRGLFGTPRVAVSRGPGGRVSVAVRCSGPFSLACSGSLEVRVPPGTPVSLVTGSGEIDARGLRAGLSAETGSGDITLQDVAGPQLTLDTGSGEIDGTGLRTPGLRAETGSGDVALALLDPPDTARVDTGSGEVELRVPDVGYRIGVDTGSGDERVEVRRDPGASRTLDLETGSGDVTVSPARNR